MIKKIQAKEGWLVQNSKPKMLFLHDQKKLGIYQFGFDGSLMKSVRLDLIVYVRGSNHATWGLKISCNFLLMLCWNDIESAGILLYPVFCQTFLGLRFERGYYHENNPAPAVQCATSNSCGFVGRDQ